MKNSILLLFYTFFCSSCFCVETNNNERNFKTENSMKDLSYFSKESTIMNNNPEFESFLMQFDLFEKEQLDRSFFMLVNEEKQRYMVPFYMNQNIHHLFHTTVNVIAKRKNYIISRAIK